MSNFTLFARWVLGTAAVALILTGCGTPQSGFGATPQAAQGFDDSTIQPDGASPCPTVGKTYTTGKGHASINLRADKIAVGGRITQVPVTLYINKWPVKREFPSWTAHLITCGSQAGKKPIGKIISRAGSSLGTGCSVQNGIENCVLTDYVWYQSPSTLPNGKPWRYDEMVFKFKTHEKGWGALPAERIELVK